MMMNCGQITEPTNVENIVFEYVLIYEKVASKCAKNRQYLKNLYEK